MVTQEDIKDILYADLKTRLDSGKIIGGISSECCEILEFYCTKDTFNKALKKFAKWRVLFNDEENKLVIKAKKQKEELNTQYYKIVYDDCNYYIWVDGQDDVRDFSCIYNIKGSIDKIVVKVNGCKMNIEDVKLSPKQHMGY
jgi:hypothetical protein